MLQKFKITTCTIIIILALGFSYLVTSVSAENNKGYKGKAPPCPPGKVFHGGPSSNHHDCPYSWNVCPYHDKVDPYVDDHSHSWKAFTDEELDQVPLRDTQNAQG